MVIRNTDPLYHINVCEISYGHVRCGITTLSFRKSFSTFRLVFHCKNSDSNRNIYQDVQYKLSISLYRTWNITFQTLSNNSKDINLRRSEIKYSNNQKPKSIKSYLDIFV